MLLFLLLLLPVCLAYYWYIQRVTNIVPMVLIGSIAALLCCGYKSLFLFSHKIIIYSPVLNFVSLLLFQTLLPIVVLYGVFVLVDHDDVKFKVNAFLPIVLSFYSIFLPYIIISETDSVYSGFHIFMKPIIFAIVLFQTGFCIEGFMFAKRSKKIIAMGFNVIVAIIYLLIPAFTETFYLFNSNFLIIMIIALVSFLFALYYIIFMRIKHGIF